MTDWTQEEDEAFNEVEKHSNLGKQILREIGQPYHFQKREWVSLTDEEISELIRGSHNAGSFVRVIEAKLKEKNEKN
jgi:predicted DNA-binding protein (MmcQ/YjbR family)